MNYIPIKFKNATREKTQQVSKSHENREGVNIPEGRQRAGVKAWGQDGAGVE